jgi:hypothetical protein
MAKRPSLFAPSKPQEMLVPPSVDMVVSAPNGGTTPPRTPTARPPSRAGKRVLSIYLDPLAWKQLRQLALQEETTTQALGEEAVNLLFTRHGLNRSA